MKILHLTHKPPFPDNDGGSSAIRMMMETMMESGDEVTTLTVSTPKHPVDLTATPSSINIQSIRVNTGFNLLTFLKCLLNGKSYFLYRFYEPAYKEKIDQLISEHSFDKVVFDGIQLYTYLPTFSSPEIKLIYRSHNIEHQLFKERASSTKSVLHKLLFNLESKKIKHAEAELVKNADAVACISHGDEVKTSDLFSAENKCFTISPFVRDSQQFSRTEQLNPMVIGYIGSMDWQPNVEGLDWFINRVWNKNFVQSELQFVVAGRSFNNFPTSSLPKNITLRGEVPDADKFLNEVQILVVPLFNGSGIRMKILHAMSHGIVVIATQKALEGIPCNQGENILVANDEVSFKRHIEDLSKNTEMISKIGHQASEFVRKNFSLQNSVNQFRSLKELIA